jgi:spore maturation protein CgeB
VADAPGGPGAQLSSSWGNGHATTYRALLKEFAARGHDILFLERDVPWYADHRDCAEPDFCRLEFYRDLPGLDRWREEIAGADAVIVGSYVPEGVAVGRFVQANALGARRSTTSILRSLWRSWSGGDFEYLSPEIIPGYDVYLSFTGGPTLRQIERRFGAPAARALYCSVDPLAYPPLDVAKRWDLSYLGTYSPDRQPTLERLLIEPARMMPDRRFVVAGPQYPADIAWPANVERIEHLPPQDHPGFYAASRFTLNVTRADMIAAGWSPSVRLFEAAACAVPVISDHWEGLDSLFTPGEEILLAEDRGQVAAAIAGVSDAEAAAIGQAARRRVLNGHSASDRAGELERYLREAMEASTPVLAHA